MNYAVRSSAQQELPSDLIKSVGGHSKGFEGENYKHKLYEDAYRAIVMIDSGFREIIKQYDIKHGIFETKTA